MELRRVEGIVEGAFKNEEGIAYHKVFFPAVFSIDAQLVNVADSDLEAVGVDLVGDYGPGARPVIEATVDVDAITPKEVLPSDLASLGHLPSLDKIDMFTLMNHYGRE
jgi:hypothetical protein